MAGALLPAYNEEQKQRVVSSGEKPPEMGQIRRFVTNMGVGIPRTATDLLTLGGMAIPAATTAIGNVGSYLGITDDPDLATQMYGKEGLSKIQDAIESRTKDEFSRLPPERQTEANFHAIADVVGTRDDIRDLILEHSPALARWGMKGANALNEFAGLNRVEDETIVDDTAQILGGALVSYGALGEAKAGETVGTKVMRRLVEMALPGVPERTVGNVSANVAVQSAGNQAYRYFNEQPSVFTGDALAADMGVGPSYTPAPTDPEAGMNGEQKAAAASGMGALAVAAAVITGKMNKSISKQAIDAIDTPPIPGSKAVDPELPLTPTLSKYQRAKADFVDQSAPTRDAALNAGASIADIDNIERVVTDTANVNLAGRHANAIQFGDLPDLDRKTVPLARVEQTINGLPEPDVKLLNDTMIAKTLMDEHKLRVQSLEEEQIAAQLGIKSAKSQGAMAKLEAIKTKKAEQTADTAHLGNIPGGDKLTVADARDMIAKFDANPALVQIEKAFRQISNDMLDADVAKGHITKEGADKIRAAHPNYMMLQEADTSSWWQRWLREFKGTKKQSLFSNTRGPLLGRSKDKDVLNPLPPVEAMKRRLYDHIQYTVMNDATKTFVNTIKDTPDYGRVIRKLEEVPVANFERSGGTSKYHNRGDVFAYTEGGKIHYYEAADKELVEALRYNAPATAAVWNGMRKLYTQGTTGIFAPVFAPTAALFEDAIARATRRPGRSYGMFDAALRRAFPDSKALSATLDKLGGTPVGPLNTSWLQMLAGVFMQTHYEELRRMGVGIADQLAQDSSIIASITRNVGGRALVEKLGEAMVRSYNESRYAAFVNAGVRHPSLLEDPLRGVRQGFDAVAYAAKGKGVVSQFVDRYRSMLDTIHNASKYAFFAQNYAALERKYNGRIPKGELKSLIHETRTLSGDMTRSVGNTTFGKTLSAIPYGQIAINSTYHLAAEIKRDPQNVGARILSGHLGPKIAAIALMSSTPELAQWYWDEIPAWQRFSRVPVIGPDWWMDFVNGNQRPLTPNDVYMMPEAPELSFLTNPVITFLRGLGAFGERQQENASWAREFAEGSRQITSIATPPLITALVGGAKIDIGNIIPNALASITGLDMGDTRVVQEGYTANPHQGFNDSGINSDSEFTRGFSNMITSLLGVSAGNIIGSTDVAVQAMESGDNFGTAMEKAFKYQGLSEERRLAELPGTREGGMYLYTGGQRRYYAGTQERDRIVTTMTKFDQLRKQLSVENDRAGIGPWAEEQGLEAFNTISDPQVKQLAVQINSVLGKGKMKRLTTERSELNKKLAILDKNKENMEPDAYHSKSNDVLRDIHAVDHSQDEIIQLLSDQLRRQYKIGIDDAFEIIGNSLQ